MKREERTEDIRAREEIGMNKHHRMKVVGSRLRWAGHTERMNEERLTKRAWKQKSVVEGQEEDRH